MSNSFETDVVVIGAGPVGLFTVFQCGMLGMSCHVVDVLDHIGGQCQALYPEKPIYDIPAYPEIKAGELVSMLEKQIEPFSPVFHLKHRAISLEKVSDRFVIGTDLQIKIFAKVVIISAGAGAFGPNRPPLNNIEEFEGKSVFYLIREKNIFCGKRVVIAGGGDSAVDWALELSKIAEKVFVIHRRKKFRASNDTVKKMHYQAENYGKIDIRIPYQLHAINGHDGNLTSVDIIDFDGNVVNISADYLLPFFGIASDLSFMKDWGIKTENNRIVVEPTTAESSCRGVFAVGDIASYPNKLKLIVTGFSEAAMAAHSAYSYVFNGKELHFEYSTNKGITKLSAT